MTAVDLILNKILMDVGAGGVTLTWKPFFSSPVMGCERTLHIYVGIWKTVNVQKGIHTSFEQKLAQISKHTTN